MILMSLEIQMHFFKGKEESSSIFYLPEISSAPCKHASKYLGTA